MKHIKTNPRKTFSWNPKRNNLLKTIQAMTGEHESEIIEQGLLCYLTIQKRIENIAPGLEIRTLSVKKDQKQPTPSV